VYERCVRHGNGTEEGREEMRKRLEGVSMVGERGQRVHMSLSGQGRFVYAEGVAGIRICSFCSRNLLRKKMKWVLGVEET